MASSRSAGYNPEEDKHLCHVYLHISQNPIIGRNQSKDQFWSRIEDEYNNSMPNDVEIPRSKRSLQARMQTILTEVNKFRGCIRQIEYSNPSGASEHDIHIRARELLMQDKKFSKGFRFDHVWSILKDSEKFADNSNVVTSSYKRKSDSSQSENPGPESPLSPSPGLSSFNVNLNDDNEESTSPAKRPIGVKKAKLKKKMNDNLNIVVNTIHESTDKICDTIDRGDNLMESNYEIQKLRAQNEREKIELKKLKEENKVLYMDEEKIKDPRLREYVMFEKERIMKKRYQDAQVSGNTSSNFMQFFSGIGGSGSDLPDY